MKLTRRKFLIATSCLAVAKIPSISFASTGLDLPNDGYLFLIHDKVYWVPEILSVYSSDTPRRPATQQTPLYKAHAIFDCKNRSWRKLRHEKFKVDVFSAVRGKYSEQIKQELFMPREVSHPLQWKDAEKVPSYGSV